MIESSAPISILLIEDDDAHAEAISRNLSSSNQLYQIYIVNTIQQFRFQIKRFTPDLIITDLNLPDGQAGELLKGSIQAMEWPVLIITGCGDEETAVSLIKSGAMDYLTKSETTFREMPRIVERTLRDWQNLQKRILAEDALRESESKYRRLVENARDMIFRLSLQTGRYDYISPACQSICGYEPEDFYRDPGLLKALFTPEFQDYFQQKWAMIIHDQAPDTFEYQIFDKSGVKRWLLQKNYFVKNQAGELTHIEGIVSDITERKKAEADRLEMERRILHVQKLESLGILSGGMAHDFNNILMGIMGYIDLARMKLPPDSPVISHLREIEKAANHAADISRQMLAYSGRGKFQTERIDLNRLIDDMIPILKKSITLNAMLHLDLDEEAPAIAGDATQMRQVIMNLTTNASEALENEAGIITISTGIVPGPLPPIEDSSFHPITDAHFYLKLEVLDTGCGMNQETIRRIYEPFFSTKFTGRGLGMAAVIGIVRSHRGIIQISSRPGEGSSFTLLFPSADDQPSNQ
ncbi:MAG: PAS domain S-box protein [Candidatus Delongbacteria bacterium]|nr:PAS domain S-box protein [Candidatus Delongbacteria bacterium]